MGKYVNQLPKINTYQVIIKTKCHKIVLTLFDKI